MNDKEKSHIITQSVVSMLAELQLEKMGCANTGTHRDIIRHNLRDAALITNMPNCPGHNLALIYHYMNTEYGVDKEVDEVYKKLPRYGYGYNSHTKAIIEAILEHRRQPQDYSYQNDALNEEFEYFVNRSDRFSRGVAAILLSYSPNNIPLEGGMWIPNKKDTLDSQFVCALYNERCASKLLAKHAYKSLAKMPVHSMQGFAAECEDPIL